MEQLSSHCEAVIVGIQTLITLKGVISFICIILSSLYPVESKSIPCCYVKLLKVSTKSKVSTGKSDMESIPSASFHLQVTCSLPLASLIQEVTVIVGPPDLRRTWLHILIENGIILGANDEN